MKSSSKLSIAYDEYMNRNIYDGKSKRYAAKGLFELGFEVTIIGDILDMSYSLVASTVGSVTPRPIWPRFNPKTLDALLVVTASYEDGWHLNTKLIKKIVQSGTDLNTVANLTGITLQELRDCLRQETGDTEA